MKEQFSRTKYLIGEEKLDKLNNAKVIVFGLGGVGSYIVEALVRSGIQNFILVDSDKYSKTNLNRQLYATLSTIGKNKVDVAKERILEINSDAKVEVICDKFMPDSKDFFGSDVSYVIDAIDTVSAKIELVERAKKYNVPIISCMGTGNKMDYSKFEITDINKTSVCPLAKVMRKELKKRGIKKLKVLYSKEEPIKNECAEEENGVLKKVPATISYMPSIAGLMIAGEVIQDLIK